jgi:hypothetical protein
MAHRRRPLRRYRATTAALTSALLVTGCSSDGSGGATEPLAVDPGVVHVHGLGTDPADRQVVYAATHTGLFRIEDGEAERVGAGYHDLMGFTITPDGTFLASGHPDMQSDDLRLPDAPPLLGLVESEDGGTSWRSRSLLGEADFHALTTLDGVVYGADGTSGQLLASADRSTWETRSNVNLISLAGRSGASADDVLVGSGAEGLVASEDGGRQWREVPDVGPGWLAVDRDDFVLAQFDGALLRSADGRDWDQVGSLPAAPEALGANDDVLHAATSEGIHRSEDGGVSWQLVYRPE